jgi:hypothetical protein
MNDLAAREDFTVNEGDSDVFDKENDRQERDREGVKHYHDTE